MRKKFEMKKKIEVVPNAIYNSREVCELLGISYRTYARMKSLGTLPNSIPVVGQPRYLGSEILDFFTRH
jgi:predicted site-specific integrase-resolvase